MYMRKGQIILDPKCVGPLGCHPYILDVMPPSDDQLDEAG